MPEELSFEQTFSQAFDAQTGEDPGDQPAAPQGQATTDSGAPTDTAQATGEGTAQEGRGGQDAEIPFNWDQFTAQHPELVPLAKQFQGDYTRKMQEIAAERQQFAGFAALQQLAVEDPAAAAHIAQQWAAQLAGGGQADQQVEIDSDPYAGVVPATDTEQFLLDRVRALEAQGQQWQQFQTQQQEAADTTRVQGKYRQIVEQAGHELSEGERLQLAGHYLKGGFRSLVSAYRDMMWDTEIARAKQSGIDEASTIVSRKAAMPGAPSPLVNRAPTAPEQPATFAAAFEQAWDEAHAGA